MNDTQNENNDKNYLIKNKTSEISYAVISISFKYKF